MPQQDKSSPTDKQQRPSGAIEKDHEPKSARPKAEARSWPTVNKLGGGGQKIAARRKIPSGPVGGSGRKTNLSRSS